MRCFGLGVLVLGVSACGSQSMHFEHQSELPVTTRGVAIDASGTDAVAGMFATTCRVSLADGAIGEDYDFPTDSEKVVDHSTLFGESAVLVISDAGAHTTYPDRVWDWSTQDHPSDGVVDGRLWSEGVALLDNSSGGGCQATWVAGSDVTRTPLAASSCDGASVSVDRDTGTMFIGAGAEVVKATAAGSSVIGHDANLVAWDVRAQVLYAAQAGDSTLYGLEADGSVRWMSDLEASIVSLDAMGPLGRAAVMVANDSGTGSLLTVDGLTGEIASTLGTPEAADQVRISDNGRAMALILPREVHFFRVQSFDF